MKFFPVESIKKIDEQTIIDEPVASVDLMERASSQVVKWITEHFDRSRRILVFTGPGNNGGDGLAVARQLSDNRYDVVVYHIDFTDKTSADWKVNLSRLQSETKVRISFLKSSDQFPLIPESAVIIDAIFGSGLTRKADGFAAEVIQLLNRSGNTIISIDIPSGLFGDDNGKNDYDNIIRATNTLTFEFPKLSFLFPENNSFTGDWTILPIGLSKKAIQNNPTPYIFLSKEDIEPLLKERKKFDHKGIFGHGLLIAGSYGRTGAAVLGTRAALRTGIGLVTCHVPDCGTLVLQSSVPEAMVDPDQDEQHITDLPSLEKYDAAAIGPGIGQEPVTQEALHRFLGSCKKPLVIDADGLNILSLHKDWLDLVPPDTILTPHPKEFERIAGRTIDSFNRLQTQISFSKKYKVLIILKGAYTAISVPDGKIYFNSTGNPGMATAGSGDTLTGILLSLLSQGYTPENAAITGVFVHGLAGDLALSGHGGESIIASDIINNLPVAFKSIRKESDTQESKSKDPTL